MMKRMGTIGVLCLAMLSACGSGERDRALGLITDLNRRPVGQGASTLSVYRTSVEESPRVTELVSLGPAAGEVSRDMLAAPPADERDRTLAIAAYVIEKTKFQGGKAALEGYLRTNPLDRGLVWSPHFAVRALLVLKNLTDSTDGHDPYSPVDFQRALTP